MTTRTLRPIIVAHAVRAAIEADGGAPSVVDVPEHAWCSACRRYVPLPHDGSLCAREGANPAPETAAYELTPYERGVADRLAILARAGHFGDLGDLDELHAFVGVVGIVCATLETCACGRASVGDVEQLPRGERLHHDAEGCQGRSRALERWQPPDDASPPPKGAA